MLVHLKLRTSMESSLTYNIIQLYASMRLCIFVFIDIQLLKTIMQAGVLKKRILFQKIHCHRTIRVIIM